MSKSDKVRDIAEAYIAAAARERSAKKEKDLLASQLLLLVPAEETMHGVKHVLESKGSPSWKGISEKIIKDLVPKTKMSVVEEIIAANTGKPREYIRAVAEE
jgi:hypothetical protein